MEPLVSIVIPTYNRPDYLEAALESAVGQTYKNLEIIVHDNASPQNIGAIVASFNDPRIIFHRNPTNIGMEPNIIAAAQKATGEYLVILGDDDLLKEEFVETLVQPMVADPDLVIAFCDHDLITSGGAIDHDRTDHTSRMFGRHLLKRGAHKPFVEIALVWRSICIISGSVMRRNAVDWADFPPIDDLANCGDIYIAYLYARTKKGCYYEPDRLMQFRWHAGAATQSDHAQRRELARSSLKFWNIFMRDRRIGYRSYFQMLCARKAARILFDELRRRDWAAIGRDAWAFTKMGVMSPRVVLSHVTYFVQFRATGIDRIP